MRHFKPDLATEIMDHGFATDGPADAVFLDIDGTHGRFRNRVSAKTYFVVRGTIEFEIDGVKTTIGERDILTITPGQTHSLSGKARAIVISCPPYDPVTEETV